MRLCREEVIRYLGYGKNTPDDNISALIDDCERELLKLESIKYAYKIYDDVSVSDDTVNIGGMEFESRDLSRHLKGCTRAAVLCATLGAGADRLRLRCEALDMTRALIMDAAQSAYIEQVCDKAMDEIMTHMGSMNATFRFSPGYGDLPLSYQPMLILMTDAQKRIGLTATDTHMLTPQKSVTAVIGFTHEDKNCGKNTCETCAAREMCRFKRV